MSVNQTVENVYIRQTAVQLTRKHFWRLLGIAVIVYAINALLQYLVTLLGDALMLPESQTLLTTMEQYLQSEQLTSSQPARDALITLLTSPKFLLYNLFSSVVISLVASGLSLGQQQQMLQTARGCTPQLLGTFGRMKYFLKGFGLELFVLLKTFLWMLPGLVLIFADAMLWQDSYSEILALLGIGLMIGLVVPAILRYSLAQIALADDPTRGIRECVALSKGWMAGRKWQYFKLDIPVLLKAMGVIFLVSFIGVLVLGAAGLTENAAAAEIFTWVIAVSTVYFDLQMLLLPALFYLKRLEPAADVPVSHWLRDHLATDIAEPSPDETTAKDSPAEDAAESEFPETNDEKENPNEQQDC